MVQVIERNPILRYVYITYMVIAVFGIVTNSVFFIVCMSFKRLRTCCRLYVAIAFADSILAVAFLLTGYRRLYEMELERSGYVAYKSASSCASEPNVALLTLGSICPAYLTLYMGADRLLSVKFPQMWNNLRSQHSIAIACIFAFSLFCLSVGVTYGFLFLKQSNTPICSYSGSYGYAFGAYVYLSTIASHVIGFLLTLLAWREISKCHNVQSSQNKSKNKEMSLTKLSFYATTACLVLVAVPNGFLFFLRYGSSSPVLAGLMYSAFCFRSSLNLFIFGYLNKEFKKCIAMKCSIQVFEVTQHSPSTQNATLESF
ncbi:hypothetical protein QR680_006257 [Steinernema hermaphroditum]|uniref:G-protein coupled receptors family 1 profile domain-containing protein n=1 Tax=Steinernema hermaphroditum TaxID=289476 RepID=A0AA39LW87_9BILA|nr:hypothetical protein QR680_006257 [Steinernema hermaphroditum]